MLGFSHAYEASRKAQYLEAARSAADWYVAHVPQGWVPRYDYNDPDRDKLPYDSCAACIATAVLPRLARCLPDRASRYQDVARETLKVLLADFLTPGGVVLHGSWGRRAPCRSRQAATGPLPAGGRDALRQLLDRRVPLSRTVDGLVYSLARRQSLTRGEFARCVVLTRASG